MKHNCRFLLAVTMMFSAMTVSAASIWSGNHDVDWSTPLQLDANLFANAQEGNKLTFSVQVVDATSDAIELKANGNKLPGTRFTLCQDWWTTYEVFMTQDMIDTCKVYGMEVTGANYKVTNIDLDNGKAGNMKEGKTIWTGYFWVDSWSTLEVFKEALTAVDLSKYKAMRFYSECPDRDNLIFLLANWSEAGVIAKSEPATDSTVVDNPLQRYVGYAELDLTKVDPLAIINQVSSDRIMIQMDKQGNNAFNFTDVVLIPKDEPVTIWSGNHDVDWSTPLQLDANLFANAKEGNKLTFSVQVKDATSDAIELKANGNKLPGTRFTLCQDWWTTYEIFMTQDMIDTCKVYGMEVTGANYKVTSIVLDGGKAGNLKEGKTIWTGYFWVDSWSTLEVFKEALTAVKNMSDYKGMRFYSECPDRDNLIFLLANWSEAGVIAKSEPATDSTAVDNPLQRYVGYAELDLTKVDPLAIINQVSSDRIMIQMDKQGNDAFNFTDVVLVPELTKTGLMDVKKSNTKATKVIENGCMVIYRNGVRYNALGTQF